MNRQELIKYYDYLNTNKTELFNSFHKLKNDRELKFSVLLEVSFPFYCGNIGEFSDEYLNLVSNIENVESRINSKIEKIDLNSDDFNLLKEQLEDYGELLDESIAYFEYLKSKVEKIINT